MTQHAPRRPHAWSGSWFRFMREKYSPFILSTKGKALVLVGSACIFAAGVYGVTQVGFCRGRAKRCSIVLKDWIAWLAVCCQQSTYPYWRVRLRRWGLDTHTGQAP